MDNARVLIVVRHPMISDALQSILELDRFVVAARVSSARDAMVQAGLHQPQIILLDSEFLATAGDELVGQLLSASSGTKVVVLADHEDIPQFTSRIGDRASGIIRKDTSADHLLTSLQKILVGREPEPAVHTPSQATSTEKPRSMVPPASEGPIAETEAPSTPNHVHHPWPAILFRALLGAAIFVLNLWLIWPLFQGGYTQFTGSIESAFLTDARFIAENGLFATWNPLWYLGYPFHLFYTPLLPYLTAVTHLSVPSLSLPSAYRIISAILYALGPVTLFYFTYYLTRRTLTALLTSVGYALLPTFSYLMMPGPSGDASQFGNAPWQMVVMIKYGEGPHITSLSFIPLAGLLFLRALRRPSILNYSLAALAISVVALINWIGLFALVVILAVLTLAEALESRPIYKLVRAFWCAAIAFALSAFWYNLGFIRASLEFGGGGGLLSNAPNVIIAGVILVYILAIRFSNRPAIKMELIAGLWLLFFGFIVLGGEYLHLNLAPQPTRYVPELSMGLVLAMSLVLTRVHDHLSHGLPKPAAAAMAPIFAIGLLAGFVFVSQPFVFGEGRSALEPHKDFTTTSEYRVAQWLAGNGNGDPAYVTGSHGFWLNVETDVPQLRGGTDQGATNRWWAHVTYQINTSPDGDISVLWLRALGIRWLVVNYPDSTDAYNDFAFPHKFDDMLTRRYFEQGTAIFEVPLANPGMIQLVDAGQIKGIDVIQNAIDSKTVTRYVEVVESPPNSGTISYRQPSATRFEIDAELADGQAILVKTTYDPNWKAFENDRPLPVVQDRAGFMLIEVPSSGFHQVRLQYERPSDITIGYVISGLTILILLGYPVLRRLLPLVRNRGRFLIRRRMPL